ncbi:MAG: hypothetical protein QM715_05425 [Nibricoccus sp.]
MTSPAHHPALMPRKKFLSRVRLHSAVAGIALFVNLGVGMLGYHLFENLGWVDAFANAALILSGMGPLAPIHSQSGKIFIGIYAIFSGVVFLTTVGFFLTPIVHRILHRLHLESTG